MSSILTYELTSQLKVSYNGEFVYAQHIDLEPPTGKQSCSCMAIESIFQSALLSATKKLDQSEIDKAKAKKQNSEENDEDEKQNSEENASDNIGKNEVLQMLMMGGNDGDMQKIILHCRDIFKHKALAGGNVKLTESTLDNLSHKDMRGMAGAYIANFIVTLGE